MRTTTKSTPSAVSGYETSSLPDISHQGTLTSEISEPFSLTICEAMPSVISSRASAAGHLACELQDGRTPSKSIPAVLPVRTIPLPLQFMATEKVQTAPGADSSIPGWPSLSEVALGLSALKTCQVSNRGSITSRKAWRALASEFPNPNLRLRILVRLICAGECGYLPTVVARDHRSPGSPNHPRFSQTRGHPLPETIGLRLSADFARWMMGFPPEWLECMPSGMLSTRTRSRGSSAR